MSFDVVRDALPQLNIDINDVEVVFVDGKAITGLDNDFCLQGGEQVSVYFHSDIYNLYVFQQQEDGSHKFELIREGVIPF